MYTVEKPGFRKMLKIFESISTSQPKVFYTDCDSQFIYFCKRKGEGRTIHCEVLFRNTDLWSSIGLKPYISYTIHYLDNEWKLQSKCLQTHFLPENHTAEVIADSLTTTLVLWELKAENQVCLTTDNGSNIKMTAEDLQWPRLLCFGHNLHLSITKSIDCDSRCSRALGLAHKIVSAFHTSWKHKRELSKTLLNLNIPCRSLTSVSP